MAITHDVTSRPSTPGSWWAGARLLRQRRSAALIGSNTLSSVGGGMQLLLLGWLAIEWGHSAIFLGVFAACRIGPKILLTMPAGIVCDRMPRARVLFLSRCGYAMASLVPLVGLFGPLPIAWLLVGAMIAGAIHAFDLSAGRAAMGDIIEPEEMHAAVALNRAGSHVAALIGPAVAFVLISRVGSGVALGVSAVMLGASAMAITALPLTAPLLHDRRITAATSGFVGYLRSSPLTLVLVMAGIAPAFIDKAVALLLPSVAGGGDGTVSMALIAPEAGALAAALVLAMAPVRLGLKALIAAAVLYAGFICMASLGSHEAEALVIALGFAGMASAALSATTHARLQGVVPAEMRGRVFAM